MGLSKDTKGLESAFRILPQGREARSVDIAEIVRGLSRQEAAGIMEMTQDRTYAQTTPIYNVDEHQQGVYLVKSGMAEEYRVTDGGNRLPISRSPAGFLFGLSSVDGKYCCFAEAVKDSAIGLLSFSTLEDISRGYPRFAVNLLKLLAGRLGDIEQRLEQLAFNELRARVAWALLGLSATHGLRLSGITHEVLAEWVAASRPKVSQVLEELQQSGVLRLSRSEINILSPSTLEEWAKQLGGR